MEPACGIAISLQDGEARVVLPRSWHGNPVATEGTVGYPRMGFFEDRVLTIQVTAPGVYTFQPPKLPGYLEPPPQRVEVRAGAFTEHVVQLERER